MVGVLAPIVTITILLEAVEVVEVETLRITRGITQKVEDQTPRVAKMRVIAVVNQDILQMHVQTNVDLD